MTKRLSPFWNRKRPPDRFDIAKLRPSTLQKRERFETHQDAHEESIRSEGVLRGRQANSVQADVLAECRAGDYVCGKPYCPFCARKFRRWFVWQVLKLGGAGDSLQVVTVLLKQVRREQLDSVDLANHRGLLRKRLRRCGVDGVVIGGFEVAYKAKERVWIFHAHLLFIDVAPGALSKFKRTFSRTYFCRPHVSQRIRSMPAQGSYVLKFGTYHRLRASAKGKKGMAKPLNPAQHNELVKWLGQHSFEQFVFLFRARRRGERIRSSANAA